jgi:ABC-type proline/glycine betaine transport system permease subunit
LCCFFSLAAECEVAVHPCKVLLICPAEASHTPILDRSTAIIAFVYPAPDGVLCLVGEVLGAVVARLVATIARAARLRHTAPDIILSRFGDATRAGGASAGILLMTDADIVALLLTPIADVR